MHDKLKQWLINLGKENNYKTWSGDSEDLDIRLKKRHTTYRPDVIWEYPSGKCIFEIAFEEDLRAVIGEIFLSSLVNNCIKLFVITYAENDRIDKEWKESLSIASENSKLKYGAELILIPYKMYKGNNINEIKKLIKNKLKWWI